MKVVLTGGHHSSAIPVIHEIKKRNLEWELFWFGHRHSMKGDTNDTLEYKEITALRIPFYEIRTGKFYRVYNPFTLLKILNGLIQSYFLLKKIKPDIIVSFGGYLAVPVILAGYLLRIPSITHEQTLVVGYANKLIAMFVNKILISWESSRIYFPNKNVVLTGIPIRTSIHENKSNEFSYSNTLPCIFILGGKTGSHLLNKIVIDYMETLLQKYNIIHQCGDHSIYNDYDIAVGKYNNLKDKVAGKYFIRKFILEDTIGEAYTKSNIVISRSGAHTISELEILHKHAVLIPIPWVSHNEQYINAKYLSDKGLAEIIKEEDITIENLVNTIDKEIQLSKLDSNIIPIKDNNAANKILDEILLTTKEIKKRD